MDKIKSLVYIHNWNQVDDALVKFGLTVEREGRIFSFMPNFNFLIVLPGDFFVDLDRQTFLPDVGYRFFFISIGNHVFLCRGWFVFSMPNKWRHAGVGRNTTSVELEQKNLGDLRCKFLRQHRTKKHPLPYKNIIGQCL